MNLKTAAIGFLGVLAIPFSAAIYEIKSDLEIGQGVTDKLAGKTTEVVNAPEKKETVPHQLEEYKPKQP